MPPISRAMGVQSLYGETSIPSRQLEDAIVGHSGPQIFQFRCQRNQVPAVHDGKVGNAKGWLMFSELVSCIGDEAVEKKPTDASHNDECKEQRDEQ